MAPADLPLRDTFWNVPPAAAWFVYVGSALSVAVCSWGFWQRVRLWRGGTPEPHLDRLPQRLWTLLRESLGQARVLAQPYPGAMHAAMLWGFLVLLAGTVVATIDWDVARPLFDHRLLQGPFYLGFELALDLFGLLLLIGLALALWRRFVSGSARVTREGRFLPTRLACCSFWWGRASC